MHMQLKYLYFLIIGLLCAATAYYFLSKNAVSKDIAQVEQIKRKKNRFRPFTNKKLPLNATDFERS